MDFIDTNILVYANDRRDSHKHNQCLKLLEKYLASGQAVISTQVLYEYASTALSKLGQKDSVVRRQIELLSSLQVVPQSAALAIRAIEIKALYGLSFWDAAIIAAAEAGRCKRILSEDMNAGQFYCGIQMVNPLAAPSSQD